MNMTLNKNQRRSLVAAAVLTSAAIAPASVLASDTKIFPASFCQPKQTDNPRVIWNFSFDDGALNMEAPELGEGAGESPDGVDMTCPILRDNHSNTDGFKFSAWVRGGSVTCSVGIRPSNLGSRIDWETRSSPAGNTGALKLDWGNSLATGAADAVYFMDCFVPVYSGIGSYRTEEP